MNLLDPRDAALQASCPAVMVPRFGEMEFLTESGHRFLVAGDGIWMEARRPWLHLFLPVGPALPGVALPYGTLEPKILYAFDKIPQTLLLRFEEEARKALPLEHAAWIVWNEASRFMSYREMVDMDAGKGGIRFDRPG